MAAAGTMQFCSPATTALLSRLLTSTPHGLYLLAQLLPIQIQARAILVQIPTQIQARGQGLLQATQTTPLQ